MWKIWGAFFQGMGGCLWFFLSGFLLLVVVLYIFKWIIDIFHL
jgi:hypothetical protein